MEEKIVIKNFKDVPILSISLQSTLWNKTGAWRYLRPAYISLKAPCFKACPIGQDIPFYLTSLSDGNLNEAWQKILEANPFPSVCGRVCHHPCEKECNRREYDEALAINSLERFLGDWGMKKGKIERTGEKRNEKIAVVGSGPAGLSCAYFLARKGCRVKVFEGMNEPGGMLRYGIPEYRLPRKILNKEIERIESFGVEIETGKKFGNDLGLEDLKPYAAVFLATGAHAEQKPKISGIDLKGVWPGLHFLSEVHSKKRPSLGKKIIVIGGGNTAIDSARAALRLGSKVTVIYRRAKEDMPAIAAEVEEAVKEGIEFLFKAAPVSILGKNGKVHAVEGIRTKPGKVDESGRKTPVAIKGSNFSLRADGVILAVGERADLSFLPAELKTKNGLISIDPWGRTNLAGIFAGGDAATGQGYVSQAIASGKKAAMAIDRYLRKEGLDSQENGLEVAGFEKINLDYFPRASRLQAPSLPLKTRAGRFKEVHGGIAGVKARKEAERCFSCGNCIHCNVCLVVCPDVAISFQENENRYAIDFDHCKGCGICAVECPRCAMTLEEEKWNE
ncbi:MAG: FAD-binding protein [Deltaproteobacteria bacterium]|nr:FAD-binding protein [Deltaproteobacteria bacterium]